MAEAAGDEAKNCGEEAVAEDDGKKGWEDPGAQGSGKLWGGDEERRQAGWPEASAGLVEVASEKRRACWEAAIWQLLEPKGAGVEGVCGSTGGDGSAAVDCTAAEVGAPERTGSGTGRVKWRPRKAAAFVVNVLAASPARIARETSAAASGKVTEGEGGIAGEVPRVTVASAPGGGVTCT